MTETQARRPEQLFAIPDVARTCRLSEKTVRRLIKAGQLPAARLGGQWRIRPRDLEDFIRDRLQR